VAPRGLSDLSAERSTRESFYGSLEDELTVFIACALLRDFEMRLLIEGDCDTSLRHYCYIQA
jgi:hypothetical protein